MDTILIVEDDSQQLEWLCDIFSDNFRVLSAHTGAKAKELFEKHFEEIRVCILDIRLSDMTSFELLDAFERMQFEHIPPTVIQSGYDTDIWVQRMLGEYCALAYLVKPYSESEIKDAVSRVMLADQSVYKGSQVQERAALLIQLRKIRQHLYHQVTQLPSEVRSHWVPKVVELFDLYGVRSVSDAAGSGEFKLKSSLKPVLDLLSTLTDFDLTSLEQALPIFFRGAVEAEATPLLPRGFSVVANHDEAAILILSLQADSLQDDLAFLKAWQLGSPARRYSLVVAEPRDKSFLEAAVQSGATHCIFKNEAFSALFPVFLATMGNRLRELDIIDSFVHDQVI